MLGIKEKIQASKKDGDLITCSNIKIYVSKQKVKQFDGVLYALIKAIENMKIGFQLNVLDSHDAFGHELPIIRIENRILSRSSFLDIIRILYLHSDEDNQGEEKNSRVTNFIDICDKLDQISTFFQFYDEETEYPYRDAYSWFLHPMKKFAYRWRKRVFSHFYEQKGLLNKSNILNDVELILHKLIEIFKSNGSKSFSQGAFGGKHSLPLDICDILITGVLSQIHFNLTPKCELVKLLDQAKQIRDFCSAFFDSNKPQYFDSIQIPQTESDNNPSKSYFTQPGIYSIAFDGSVSIPNLCLFFESQIHQEVQEARQKANEKVPSIKKLRKMMINNISVNSLVVFLMAVVLYKYKPKEAEQLTIEQ